MVQVAMPLSMTVSFDETRMAHTGFVLGLCWAVGISRSEAFYRDYKLFLFLSGCWSVGILSGVSNASAQLFSYRQDATIIKKIKKISQYS